MSFHPAYPTAADLSSEHNAARRDLQDLQTLDGLKLVVARAIEAAGQFDRIHSPNKHWSTAHPEARSWLED
jgi:hypothetical protein